MPPSGKLLLGFFLLKKENAMLKLAIGAILMAAMVVDMDQKQAARQKRAEAIIDRMSARDASSFGSYEQARDYWWRVYENRPEIFETTH